MKEDRLSMEANFSPFKKYMPSPEDKIFILNYFRYNSFQDFNTWQQIAKTKLDYQYQQKGKKIICNLFLKWEDKITPKVCASGQARAKKNAKKKALTQLIENLIFQGFICRGFRDHNFVEKLPRRRKNYSDESSEEDIKS